MPVFLRPNPLLFGYTYGMVDVPGVVAANNFLSVFNPSASTMAHIPLTLGLECYAIALTEVLGTMGVFRTTAASGGTLVASSNHVKFQTSNPTAQCEVRVGNPTVTRVNNTPLSFKSPVVTDKVGTSGTVTVSSPIQNPLGFALYPGEGLVFATTVGAVAETWNIQYAWGEIHV